MKVFKKVLNITVNVLIVFVLIFSVLLATVSIVSKNSGIPSFLGYTVQPILTPSMDGGHDDYKGVVNQYDLTFAKAVDIDAKNEYKVGDIITYKGLLKGNEDLGDQFICHRIVEVAERGGEKVYRTKGDNSDYDQYEIGDYISSHEIVSVYYSESRKGFKIPFLGRAFTKDGFFFCILIPMIIFFLYVLIRVVIDAVNYKNAKMIEERESNKDSKPANMTDEEYEQFKAFMAQKNAEKEEVDKATEETVATDAEVSEETEA